MKMIILTSDSPNQIALCNKIAEIATIDAIIISALQQNLDWQKKLTLFPSKILQRLVNWPLFSAWQKMQKRYQQLYPNYPKTSLNTVPQINHPETLKIIEKSKADLIAVSGTELIKPNLIYHAHQYSRSIINLHTGLSPYMNGGPNCTNWCLANNLFHFIGNTVMYLAEGIDSGDIITTEKTLLTGKESLLDLHWKVMEHAHSIYLNVIKLLRTKQKLRAIPQHQISTTGRTFYMKEWSARNVANALINYHLYFTPDLFSSEAHQKQSANVKCVSLEDIKP